MTGEGVLAAIFAVLTALKKSMLQPTIASKSNCVCHWATPGWRGMETAEMVSSITLYSRTRQMAPFQPVPLEQRKHGMDGVGHLAPPRSIEQDRSMMGCRFFRHCMITLSVFRQIIHIQYLFPEHMHRSSSSMAAMIGVVVDDGAGPVDNEQPFAEPVKKRQEFLISDVKSIRAVEWRVESFHGHGFQVESWSVHRRFAKHAILF
jgi:hypothetical protein